MSTILRIKLDVSKLDKSAFFKGEKGTYCDLTVFINDTPDQFGNDASVKQDLGKERRNEKTPYCGNGKYAGQRPQPTNQSTTAQQSKSDDFGDEDDIPF